MTLIRSSRTLLVCAVLAVAVTGCGRLGDELERERNPARTPEPVATPESSPGLAGIPDPHEPPSEFPTAPAQGSCPMSGVLIEPGVVDAAMGLRAMRVTLTNCGTQEYALKGYPAVQVLDEDHQPFDNVRVTEGPGSITTAVPDDGEPRALTLRPGQAAKTVLVWRNTNNATGIDAAPVNGTHLMITATRDTPPQKVTPEGGIDLGTTGLMGTTAWTMTESLEAVAPPPSAGTSTP